MTTEKLNDFTSKLPAGKHLVKIVRVETDFLYSDYWSDSTLKVTITFSSQPYAYGIFIQEYFFYEPKVEKSLETALSREYLLKHELKHRNFLQYWDCEDYKYGEDYKTNDLVPLVIENQDEKRKIKAILDVEDELRWIEEQKYVDSLDENSRKLFTNTKNVSYELNYENNDLFLKNIKTGKWIFAGGFWEKIINKIENFTRFDYRALSEGGRSSKSIDGYEIMWDKSFPMPNKFYVNNESKERLLSMEFSAENPILKLFSDVGQIIHIPHYYSMEAFEYDSTMRHHDSVFRNLLDKKLIIEIGTIFDIRDREKEKIKRKDENNFFGDESADDSLESAGFYLDDDNNMYEFDDDSSSSWNQMISEEDRRVSYESAREEADLIVIETYQAPVDEAEA